MKSVLFFILCIRYGHFLLLDKNAEVLFKPTEGNYEILEPGNEAARLLDAKALADESSEKINSTGGVSQPNEYSTDNSTRTASILTEIFASESSSVPNEGTPSNQEVNGSTPLMTKDAGGDDEKEGVARGKPPGTESENSTTTSKPETIYQKTLALINDTYTLSILIPVAAGVVFASTILVFVATCRCLRRRCRRRRLRRKALPDSVKCLRPSDRARLLAESSDEEF